MLITRREAGLLMGAAAVPARANASWTPDHDRAVMQNALRGMDSRYDAAEHMISHHAGNDYSYHSAFRNTTVHPTRESLEYALYLLEAGRGERAAQVIERVIAEQDTDTKSRFYGIWGWYMEEPANKMNPADFNWADFNGSLLLLIELRHGSKLSLTLRKKVLQSIHHAAYSIRKRNVTMAYTNIAAQGTFVTLAAGKLLDDQVLWDYAVDRQRRFSAKIDETGSFAEYNSPTYANVTIVNLTRIATYIKDERVLKLNTKLSERIWDHLANHWHVGTRQLAGPMSRCYSTDIGKPVWLQKALNGALEFVSLAELQSGKVSSSGEVAVTAYNCTPAAASKFLNAAAPHQYRETFLPGVQGTTWLDKDYCVGSVNRGDFWIQRRPLLAYWKPSHSGQLRFMKDDYEFSSALLYSTQERDQILGAVNFRSPGGDKHISIDMVKNGQFEAKSLRLQLDITDPNAKITVSGLRGVIESAGIRMELEVRGGAFGSQQPSMRAARNALVIDLVRTDTPQLIRWSEVASAFLVFTFFVGKPAIFRYESKMADGQVSAKWGDLELTAGTRVTTVAKQEAAFQESRAGKPVKLERISDEHLAG